MEEAKPWDHLEIDEFGTDTIVLTKEIVHFPKFMHFVVKEKVGMSRGYFKISFDQSIQRSTTLDELKDFVLKYFNTKELYQKPDNRNRGKWKIPSVSEQRFFYGDHKHNLYGYRSFDLSAKEEAHFRTEYLQNVMRHGAFSEETVCSKKLSESVEILMNHYWSVIRSVSEMSSGMSVAKDLNTDYLLKKGKDNRPKYVFTTGAHQRTNDQVAIQVRDSSIHSDKTKASERSIIYAADIPVTTKLFKVSPNFSLSNLDNLLDVFDGESEGITHPVLCGGMEYATFPWHTENNELFSMKYLHYGAPCVWLIVSPDYFKTFTDVVKKFYLDLAQVSCENIIGGGHKYIVASEEFLATFGIPVHKVIQKEREIIVVYPFTAHTGFSLGLNFQETVNFADEFWVEPAIFSRRCVCFSHVPDLDLAAFIAVCRPHLLEMYLKRDFIGLAVACSENEFLKRLRILPALSVLSRKGIFHAASVPDGAKNVASASAESGFKGANCTLHCPSNSCNQKFKGGRSKLFRLEKHIRQQHPEQPKLLEAAQRQYPPKDRKSKALLCPHCGEWRSGGISQMKLHISRRHSNIV